MNAEEFVEAIRRAVSKQSINDVFSSLETPPGRAPKKELVAASLWFKTLGPSDRACLQTIVERSVDSAVFGFMCVLDGVRTIEPADSGGKLILEHVKGEERIRLNDESASLALHDFYNAR